MFKIKIRLAALGKKTEDHEKLVTLRGSIEVNKDGSVSRFRYYSHSSAEMKNSSLFIFIVKIIFTLIKFQIYFFF